MSIQTDGQNQNNSCLFFIGKVRLIKQTSDVIEHIN